MQVCCFFKICSQKIELVRSTLVYSRGGMLSPFSNREQTRGALSFSLWALEKSAILPLLLPSVCQRRGAHSCPPPRIRVILQVPAAASISLPVHCRQNACPAITRNLHQHPGSTGSFLTKKLFLHLVCSLLPVVLLVWGEGACFLELWRLVCSVVSFVLSPSPTAWSRDLSAILSLSSGPHGLPRQQHLVFLPWDTIWPSSFCVFF